MKKSVIIEPLENEIPPRSPKYKDLKIFAEKFVLMRGQKYYMRQFYDGSSEFVAFDYSFKKWIFLCFPAENREQVSS